MITSLEGQRIIKMFEGCKLAAYLCPAGIPTIGFGHTGPETRIGQKITQHQADEILTHDLQKFESAIGRLCPLANANQFSAMVSLCFNIGEANFAASSLRRKFNANAPLSAADEFLKWNKATVKGVLTVLPGLTKRREAERLLFLTAVS